jgi:hypothetical protein
VTSNGFSCADPPAGRFASLRRCSGGAARRLRCARCEAAVLQRRRWCNLVDALHLRKSAMAAKSRVLDNLAGVAGRSRAHRLVSA